LSTAEYKPAGETAQNSTTFPLVIVAPAILFHGDAAA
jgi:hypothetical protein